MIHFLIGHRGAGKTRFLARLRRYYREAGRTLRAIDLDAWVGRREGRSIEEIFRSDGEHVFRHLEHDALEAILTGERTRLDVRDLCIAIGAGCAAPLPARGRCLWIRRKTDIPGRVFLDRPRLDPRLSPLAEYRERFAAREARYRACATSEWVVGEGFDAPNPMERAFAAAFFGLPGPAPPIRAIVSLTPPAVRWSDTVRRLDGWPGVRFEVRDDLLSPDDLRAILRAAPLPRVLFSFRSKRPLPADVLDRVRSCREIDWPAELPDRPPAGIRPTIHSLHERRSDESLASAIGRLEARGSLDPAATLKLAVEVFDFGELEQGHVWAAADPERRAFLPRTPGSEPDRGGFGRWAWYRELHLPICPLPFVRDGEGTSIDQPTWLEALRRFEVLRARGDRSDALRFAAVLGDPILHSRTPAEQFRFFLRRGVPVVAVHVRPSEWLEAIDPLRRLGLRYAAVTSPLKRQAAEAAEACSRAVVESGAANTLYWSEARSRWVGASTDLEGLEALAGSLRPGRDVAIWGGGGTLGALRHMLPAATPYSARTASPREAGRGHRPRPPRVVVWVAGRRGSMPPAAWRPRAVVDLDYAEDSRGRTYALAVGASYTSGLAMFHAQAAGQRRVWSREERRDAGSGRDGRNVSRGRGGGGAK